MQYKIKQVGKAVFRNPSFYFREGITWSGIASSGGTFRYTPEGYLFDSNKGPMIFDKGKGLYNVLGMLNTKVSHVLIGMLNPTVSLQIGDIYSIPYAELTDEVKKKVDILVSENIELAREDWNSFETSWEFATHPLIKSVVQYSKNNENNDLISNYNRWEKECSDRFKKLKENEEKLNSIFIDIYGLNNELTPYIEEKEITVRKADLFRDIRSFVSYAVGCMFGRYSLNKEGLIYAGGEWDNSRYKTFLPDEDNCIPITDEEYFSDDIVGRFVEFVKIVYGADTLRRKP